MGILEFLILLEAAFIGGSYWSHISWIALIFSGVYASIAFADSRTKDRNLSILVLLLSIGVAFPRLTFQYEKLIEERRENITISEQVEPALYKPEIQNCEKLPKWAEAKDKKDCTEGNRKEREKEAASKNAIAKFKNSQAKEKTNSIKSASLRLSDWGMFFAYGMFSVCLPFAIFLLIHAPALEKIEPVKIEPTKSEEETFLDSIKSESKEVQAKILKEKGWHYLKICEFTGLSRATYFRTVRKNHSQNETAKILPLKVVNGGLHD